MKDITKYIGSVIKHVRVDRPIGSLHPQTGMLYSVSCGFIPGTKPDNGSKEIDCYILGIFEPKPDLYDMKCIAVINREGDDEQKLVVCPPGIDFSKEQIESLVAFQERFYKSSISTRNSLTVREYKNIADGEYPREVKLYADGGSRGNPGPSAGGFVLLDMNDQIIEKNGKYLGITTNNQAEYHSLKGGLEAAYEQGVRIVHVYMDSLLVINQILGIYKIKNRDLWPIHDSIKKLVTLFDKVNFQHIPRELNRLADTVVNETLDNHKDGI